MACFVGCFVSQRNRIKWKKIHKQGHTIISGCHRSPSHHSEAKPFCSHFSLEFSEPKISSGHTNGWKTIENQFVSMAVEDWTRRPGKPASSCHVSAREIFFFASALTPPEGRAKEVFLSNRKLCGFFALREFLHTQRHRSVPREGATGKSRQQQKKS